MIPFQRNNKGEVTIGGITFKHYGKKKTIEERIIAMMRRHAFLTRSTDPYKAGYNQAIENMTRNIEAGKY